MRRRGKRPPFIIYRRTMFRHVWRECEVCHYRDYVHAALKRCPHCGGFALFNVEDERLFFRQRGDKKWRRSKQKPVIPGRRDR